MAITIPQAGGQTPVSVAGLAQQTQDSLDALTTDVVEAFAGLDQRITATDTKITPMRLDTTAGTRVFVTLGGADVMLSGDTGPRNIAALFDSTKYTSLGRADLRREGGRVTLYIRQLKNPQNGQALFTIPAGFRPPDIQNFPVSTLANAHRRAVIYANALSLNGLAANDELYFTISWMTTEAWPTTLPGTPG